MTKVRTIKEFNPKFGYGELDFFFYQYAFGISIRYLECDGMGWMFRVYFGSIKFWFNFKRRSK